MPDLVLRGQGDTHCAEESLARRLTGCLSLVPLVVVLVVVALHGLLHAAGLHASLLHATLLHASVSSHCLQVTGALSEPFTALRHALIYL